MLELHRGDDSTMTMRSLAIAEGCHNGAVRTVKVRHETELDLNCFPPDVPRGSLCDRFGRRRRQDHCVEAPSVHRRLRREL